MTNGLDGGILITGGSGTLGQALVRTALREGWGCRFTIYSRSELLQSQMRAKYPECTYVLGDVRDDDRLSSAIAGHQTVIHAAAMKRIPECEVNPSECYATNIQGSMNVIRACIAHGVNRCVGISTDKACQAITAYGASKLAMEKLFQAAPTEHTIFTLVRYGNVVASRGSVIPLWQQLAKAGKPLPITDPAMTRFWMSIQDAVNLVVLGLQQRAKTILVAKMGALPIVDMARMIAPRADLVTVGLRSDEKLHEDLIHADELVLDDGRYFRIDASGKRGTAYSSETAPRLTPDAFLAMLQTAVEYE